VALGDDVHNRRGSGGNGGGGAVLGVEEVRQELKPCKFPDSGKWNTTDRAYEKWHDDYKAWLTARRDKEQSFLDKGHLSEESLLVAKVLVMRYNEALEWL